MSEIPVWHAKGQWFDACKCGIPCPCSWAQPPTDGDCQGVLVWHINEGRYGEVALDGLNVVGIGYFTGNVWGVHSKAGMGVIIDARGDDKQRAAMQMIFGGQAGGWPAKFAEIVGGEMIGLEFAPIEVEIASDLAHWRVEVVGKVLARGEALSGPTNPHGKPVQVHNLPGAETGPGQVSTWGAASANKVDVFGQKWDWAAKSSKHMTFDWSGPDS